MLLYYLLIDNIFIVIIALCSNLFALTILDSIIDLVITMYTVKTESRTALLIWLQPHTVETEILFSIHTTSRLK